MNIQSRPLKRNESEIQDMEMLYDVLQGMSRVQKTLPCKYLYDERGAELFNAICKTPEYYITRTELAIMQRHLREITQAIGSRSHVLEFGSGEGIKTKLLLQALEAPSSYTPMDISRQMLAISVPSLEQAFPKLLINPVCADFTEPFPALEHFSAQAVSGSGNRVVYFPGSTLSNFQPPEAETFLRRVAKLLSPAGGLLIGIDLIKDKQLLHAAYNDSAGITARFNKNMLVRLNRELGADFDIEAFEHLAPYNEALQRIEMHLVSRKKQQVKIAGRVFSFAARESIHTENSYKYSIQGFSALAQKAGLQPEYVWTDAAKKFSIHYLNCRPA